MSGVEGVLILLVVLAIVVSAVLEILVVVRRRRIVFATSSALGQLGTLNVMWFDAVKWLPPIEVDYRVRVNSKSKFDRFDLRRHMTQVVLENEGWFAQEIQRRIVPTHQFANYNKQAEQFAALLGSSADPRVNPKAFARLERKAFDARRFSYPVPSARVTTTLSYTSPQGRNSYSNRLTWDFDELARSFENARAERARMSSAEAKRQRERSLMTSGLRMDVLRRDNFRCQMCGVARGSGVQLHIDHIVPVSRGGATELTNLQVLCEDCNYGKSNRFVG